MPLEGYCIDCDQCRDIRRLPDGTDWLPLNVITKDGIPNLDAMKCWLRDSDDCTQTASSPPSPTLSSTQLLFSTPSSPLSPTSSVSLRSPPSSASTSLGKNTAIMPTEAIKKILEKETGEALARLNQIAINRAVAHRFPEPKSPASEDAETDALITRLESLHTDAIKNGIELYTSAPSCETDRILSLINRLVIDHCKFNVTNGRIGKDHSLSNISRMMSVLARMHFEKIRRLEKEEADRQSAEAYGLISAANAEHALEQCDDAEEHKTSASSNSHNAKSRTKNSISNLQDRSSDQTNKLHSDADAAELDAVDTERHTRISEAKMRRTESTYTSTLSTWERNFVSGNLTQQEAGALNRYYEAQSPSPNEASHVRILPSPEASIRLPRTSSMKHWEKVKEQNDRCAFRPSELLDEKQLRCLASERVANIEMPPYSPSIYTTHHSEMADQGYACSEGDKKTRSFAPNEPFQGMNVINTKNCGEPEASDSTNNSPTDGFPRIKRDSLDLHRQMILARYKTQLAEKDFMIAFQECRLAECRMVQAAHDRKIAQQERQIAAQGRMVEELNTTLDRLYTARYMHDQYNPSTARYQAKVESSNSRTSNATKTCLPTPLNNKQHETFSNLYGSHIESTEPLRQNISILPPPIAQNIQTHLPPPLRTQSASPHRDDSSTKHRATARFSPVQRHRYYIRLRRDGDGEGEGGYVGGRDLIRDPIRDPIRVASGPMLEPTVFEGMQMYEQRMRQLRARQAGGRGSAGFGFGFGGSFGCGF